MIFNKGLTLNSKALKTGRYLLQKVVMPHKSILIPKTILVIEIQLLQAKGR